MNDDLAPDPAARIDGLLGSEPALWLSSVRPEGGPHLVPIWFSWDGVRILIASKPHAQKVRNLRANSTVVLALGEPEDDFDVGLLEGTAELLDVPAAIGLPGSHLARYADRMAAIGLGREEFLATYSPLIRIRPTRFLPWHGRTIPRPAGESALETRLAAAIRRVAVSLEPRPSAERSFLGGFA
jgi:PPOX class probable F420-dependent enzyme